MPTASYPRYRGKMKNGLDRWELRASAGTNPATGKPDYLYGSFHGGKTGAKDAQAKLVRRAAAMRGQAQPIQKSPAKQLHERTFTDAGEAWFEWASPKMEPNGRDNVRQILDDYLYPNIGSFQLWRFRGELALEEDDEHDELLVDLTEFFERLMIDGGKRGGPLAPSTIKSGPARVAGAVFDYAVRRNWLATNPASRARRPHVPDRSPTTPTAPVMFRFFGFLMDFDPELYAWVELMNSGARRVDMAVQWNEWRPERSEIILGARGLILARPDDELALLPLRGGRRAKRVAMVRQTPTSKRRYRTVALDASANAALSAHRLKMLELAMAAGLGGLNPDGYIFAMDAEGLIPRRPDWASQAFGDARLAAAEHGIDIGSCRMYDTRHFMATELYAAGIQVAVLAERMGNSPMTIEKYYRHAQPAKDQEAADVMAELRAQALAGRPTVARARRRA